MSRGRVDHRNTRMGRILVWLMAAAVLWLAARAMDRSTRLEIFSSGSTLRVTVADSVLTAPVAIESVDRIEIWSWASVFPIRGRSMEIRQGTASREVIDLPSHFRLAPGSAPPVADWEIDNRSARGSVFHRSVRLSGPFELSAVFTGRIHQHLAVRLRGTPTVSVSFRRGLINNDIFIWDEEWTPIAVTSLDPQPAWDLAAATALVLDSAVASALLIALFVGLAGAGKQPARRQPEPLPATGLRAMACPAGLAAAATVCSLWFADRILERLPHLPDSVVYLLQARWLLDGRLVPPVSAIQQHLDVPFTYVVNGGWIAHYPFGWPAMLATGLAAGAAWAVPPLLGGIYVVLLWWLGTTLYDRRVGCAAACLGALSPMARVIFGSHLSHAGSATLILGFLVLVQLSRRRHGVGSALAGGMLLGLAFGMRPLSALAAAIPCGIQLLMDCRKTHRDRSCSTRLAAVIIGGVVGTTPLLIQNLLITGSPFALPYSFARGSMYSLENVPFGIRNLDAILASTVPAIHGWGWGLSGGWLFLALPLALAMVPFLLRRHTASDALLAAWFLCLMAVHVGTEAHGLHGFGPRYYFDAFAAIFLLTARGFQELARMTSNTQGTGRETPTSEGTSRTRIAAVVLFAALAGSTAVTLPQRLGLYRGYNGVDASLERAVAHAGVDRGLILFGEDNWRDWAMAARMMTGPRRHDLIFARSHDRNSALWNAYPDLPAYIWKGGRLEALARPD